VTAAAPSPPADLAEFLDQYLPRHLNGRRASERAARFTTQLVTAADAGTEPPPIEDLPGEDLYQVGELLSALLENNRMYVRATPLLFRLVREYRQQVEITDAPPPEPGQRWQPLTARLKPRPAPVFRPSRELMLQPPGVVARQLGEFAASAEAAARFVRSLASGVGDTGAPGEVGGADASALDAAGREAVRGLLQACANGLRAHGSAAAAADMSQIAKAWQDWQSGK
jgi:hypothetical protein